MIKRLVQLTVLLLATFLFGCGGSNDLNPTYATVDVTPVAGKFKSGTVAVFGSTGTQLGTGVVNQTTGKATVTLNVTYVPSIMVLRVSGGKHYDEGTNNPDADNDFMLSVVSSGAAGGNYPVTPLTHMAAAFAGVDGSASSLTVPTGATALSTTTIERANKLVPYLFGVDPALLDITVVPTLIDSASPTLSSSASAVRANSYAYMLAVLSYNAYNAPTRLTNAGLTAALFTEAKAAYTRANKTSTTAPLSGGTFNWPSYMTEINGSGRTVLKNSMPTGSGLGAVFAAAGADQVINSRVDALGDIGTAVSYIGRTQTYVSTAPGSYCPNYLNSAGQQVLDPTDPKNTYIFFTATGYMTDGFRVTSWSGTSTSFTIFNGAPSAAGESGSSGVYLQYYTVYGLPSWASGGSTGGIFTGTYSGTSGGTDGYALNTLMMADGYTGTGTFNLTYSGMNTSTPYKLSTTGSSSGGLRQVVLSCPNV